MMVQSGEKHAALIRKQQENMFRRFAQLLITATLSLAFSDSAGLFAQGLSGVSKRLDETLNQQSNGGSSSGRPSMQQPGSGNQGSSSGYGAGGSSAPPAPSSGRPSMQQPGSSNQGSSSGYGAGGSSAPPAPSSGQQMSGYPGGSSSGPGMARPQPPGLIGPGGLGGLRGRGRWSRWSLSVV